MASRCGQISYIDAQNIQDNPSPSDSSSSSDEHFSAESEVTIEVCKTCYDKINSQAMRQQTFYYAEITTGDNKTVTLRSKSLPQYSVNASTKKYFYGNRAPTSTSSDKRKYAEEMSKIVDAFRFFDTAREKHAREATSTNQNMCSDLTGFYHISIAVLKDVSEMKACLNQLHPLMASLPEKFDANTRNMKKKLEHSRKLRRSPKKWSEQVAHWGARLEANFKEVSINAAATKEEIISLRSDIAEVNRNKQLETSKIDTLNTKCELLLHSLSTASQHLAENEKSKEEATTSNQELSDVKAWMDEISPLIASVSKRGDNEPISGELTEIRKELSDLREGFNEQIDTLKEVKNVVQCSVYKKLSNDLEEKPEPEIQEPTDDDVIAKLKAIDKFDPSRFLYLTQAECKLYVCCETVEELYGHIRRYHHDYTDFSHAKFVFDFLKGNRFEVGLKRLNSRLIAIRFPVPIKFSSDE